MINFKRDSDNLVVAGNGPSLKNIDLNSLPSDFDVFRCNQFYAEKQYYLGKKIKLVMFNPQFIYSQLKTINEIQKRKEYDIDYICLNYVTQRWAIDFDINHLISFHPYIYILKDLLDYQYLKELSLYDYYDNLRPTSGILLILLGKSLGYKNIYYIGMDFLDGASLEQIDFNINSNISKLIYKNNNFGIMHDKEIDKYFAEKVNTNKIITTTQKHEFDLKSDEAILDIIDYKEIDLNKSKAKKHKKISEFFKFKF